MLAHNLTKFHGIDIANQHQFQRPIRLNGFHLDDYQPNNGPIDYFHLKRDETRQTQ